MPKRPPRTCCWDIIAAVAIVTSYRQDTAPSEEKVKLLKRVKPAVMREALGVNKPPKPGSAAPVIEKEQSDRPQLTRTIPIMMGSVTRTDMQSRRGWSVGGGDREHGTN